ncbi:MAG: valine--tRNA ligase [Nitrospinae bacterium]|nr:valine--tRNA ligase [Nitrospinota bacterium]
MEELSTRYEPAEVSKRWYAYWMEKGYFKAKDGDTRPSFCIVIPPPNVTGSLHVGHALDNTLQDILIRHRRMSGYNTLWMPGTDHAGIATQNVVERELKKEGFDRHQLGREKFIERVWQWKEEYGHKIINQLQELGASCDWDRQRFTMDEGLSRAVREVFVRLYEEGLIYRSNYITNWCPRCHTALSDLEVEYAERNSQFYHINYSLADGGGALTIATTRPETMLGDTAIAVNPEDERYKRFIGKTVILPLVGREIPVIGDSYVAADFGTGALKITPAHDPNDFEIGKRHNLPSVVVIGRDARMQNCPEKYVGMSREECRKAIVEDLKEQGFLVEARAHKNAVGECYRCKTVVEPNLSMQWFVKTAPLAEEAVKAVKTGDIKFVPQSWENTYFEWMNNIRDWCISRQIWWGHRIPAWYCEDCGHVNVAREEVVKCAECGGITLRQETDVLDTWFSSGLWPFSTLGWPDNTEALKTFYPTSVLVTGLDIIFFWVARMIMMGIKFTGKPPFSTVYIHALVRDAEGKKMSKSKGNVVDPLQLMMQYGTDALRFTICANETQGRDARMSEKRIEGYRNFVNKLWNASRFVLMNSGDYDGTADLSKMKLEVADRWILSRLQKTIAEADAALEQYRFNDLANALYRFTWGEFCDWYIELTKPRLVAGDKAAVAVLTHVLDNMLRLLHPIMPFVTEEIYQKLPNHGESVMIAPYPKPDTARIDAAAEAEMELVMALVSRVRAIRAELQIPFSVELRAIVKCRNAETEAKAKAHEQSFLSLTKAAGITFDTAAARPPQSATGVLADAEIYVPLTGIIDFDKEIGRIQRELAKVQKELAMFDKKFGDENFMKNAPEEVVEKDKAAYEEAQRRQKGLEDSLSWLNP